MINSSYFEPRLPDAGYLKAKAASRIPKFAYDYLEGGCIDEIAPLRNREDIQNIVLNRSLLRPPVACDLSTTLFGQKYQYPFGIAPIGLQGLMWPKAPEILAKTALQMKIPYMLSTVSSAKLETIAELAESYAWFQFYNPTVESIRTDLLNRAQSAGVEVLAVTVDVPTFGYRPKDIRNGLSMPPKMTWRNLMQMASKPHWLLATARAGKPSMQTLSPYIPPDTPTDQLADFMNKTVMGPVDTEGLKRIRELWSGKLLVKGVATLHDAKVAQTIGVDGIMVSNHGGRQLDAGPKLTDVLQEICADPSINLEVLFDSGIYSGTDIARVLACGASFTFCGRLFVYGVGALGEGGGIHTVNMLARQLDQVACQLGCSTPKELTNCLVN